MHHLDAPPGAPILLLLHGLEGTIRSHYIQGLLGEASRRKWRGIVLIFRSCGDELNRTSRFYHSGETTDLDFVVRHLENVFANTPLLLAGTSLGGNVLLKYLGEHGMSAPSSIRAAAAVSVPFDLARSARHIDRGFAKAYQRNFLRSLRRKAISKLDRFPPIASRDAVVAARTMVAFDDCFTAPVHGFRDAEDYYSRSSSIAWLDRISINTLLLSAVDDPFLPAQVLDEVRAIADDNPSLHLEFPPRGGHVGFVEGRNPFRPAYYLERRVGDFLAEQLRTTPVGR
jgi:predicted alpha/beta-fold hydrolase